jgi:hypothetical protein
VFCHSWSCISPCYLFGTTGFQVDPPSGAGRGIPQRVAGGKGCLFLLRQILMYLSLLFVRTTGFHVDPPSGAGRGIPQRVAGGKCRSFLLRRILMYLSLLFVRTTGFHVDPPSGAGRGSPQRAAGGKCRSFWLRKILYFCTGKSVEGIPEGVDEGQATGVEAE